MMLDQEARPVAERLGLDRHVEIIAEALPGLGPKIGGAGLRGAENSKLHDRSVAKKPVPTPTRRSRIAAHRIDGPDGLML